MSNYKDLIQDFPARCLDILENFYASAQIKNREITLLIMAASTLFLIPIERLRKEHLSQDCRDHVELEKNIFGNKTFISFNFCASPEQWLYGRTQNIQSAPDDWGEFSPISNQTVSEIISIIRNALAHGNIYVQGNPISTLLFWSNQLDDSHVNLIGYKYIKIPVYEFYEFIKRWVAFLNQ